MVAEHDDHIMHVPELISLVLNAMSQIVERFSQTLPVDIPDQEDTLWCWAAVATGIARFYSKTAEQHEIASAVLSKPCRPKGANPDCSMMAGLIEALKVHGNYASIQGPVDILFVAKMIAAGRPLCARVEDNGTPHFLTIRGYDIWGNIYIDDPAFFDRVLPFSEFQRQYLSKYTWTHTYETIP